MNKKFHPKAIEQTRSYKKNKADLIETLSEIDKTKEYLDHGVNSLFRYCTEVLSLSESNTYQFTQVIRKSQEVPKLKEAIIEGKISVEKASRIAPVITETTQDEWIAKAQASSHRDIEKAVREVKPKGLKKEKITQVTGDKARLHLNISTEAEKKLRRLQEVYKTTSFEETIEKAFDIALKHSDPLEKAKRATERKELRTCEVKTQKPMTRYIPQALKHQVNLRDKGECQHKGCGSKMFTQIHHVIEIAKGGRHELGNLTTLCWMHHNQTHDFQFGLYKKATFAAKS